MMSPALNLSRSPSSSISSSPLDRCRRSPAAVWRHHGPSFAYKPAAGICYASQAVELLPSLLRPEIVVRDARLEDCWEVADTHFPPGCMRTCLVAVNSNSVNNSFNIECGDPRDAGFQKYNLSRESIAGILTVDTVADYLPRRGPLKQRRARSSISLRKCRDFAVEWVGWGRLRELKLRTCHMGCIHALSRKKPLSLIIAAAPATW
ncbi:hypothetical protein PR202_ga03223 [Eleusine coracana subsp. coracana]|uniref:Uncharacterized protein n=1 Tax=Eleusine coracana subsp. coracana TaxID=191504 RepID=A0AAV5BLT0_ELECO|nr:hypothetical protein PR202_ga03223 [Eleusine coracana subsp. coracana]